VCLYGSSDGIQWHCALQHRKDDWPMRWFQYGNAFLPDGKNITNLLAVTTVAVEHTDLETTIWRV
jgi:lysyl-tRNA synthetase class I